MYRYSYHAVPIQMMLTAAKTTNIPDPKLLVSHLIFIQFNKKHKHIEFDLNYVELLICGQKNDHCVLELVFEGFTE